MSRPTYAMSATLRDGRQLTIREATVEDAAALHAHNLRVGGESDFLGYGPGEYGMTLADEARGIQIMRDQGHLLLIGLVAGQIVGNLNGFRGRLPRIAHILEVGISVSRAAWGIGVGRALMRASLDWATATGVRKVNLRVRTDNARALALYRALGFVEEGRGSRACCIAGQFYDDLALGMTIDPPHYLTAPPEHERR